jgi:hypothetical protein
MINVWQLQRQLFTTRKIAQVSMLGNKINISIYSLAVLPVDYLDRHGDPLESVCGRKDLDSSCRHVFSSGIRAYQLATYLGLVREQYGRGVANQIGSYQQRLLQPDGAVPNEIMTAIHLVRGALESQSVTADTGLGSIDIPIEMNVALALLLGMPASPYFAAVSEQRAAQANSMGMDIDWSLSQCLVHAREEMEKVFSPLLACISSGVRVDFVRAWLNEKCPSGKAGHHH